MMSTELERLRVIIDATIAPFKDSIKEVKLEIKKLQSDIKNGFSGKDNPQIKPEVNTEEPMSRIRELQLAIKSKIADMKVGTGLFDYTDEFKTILSDMGQAEEKARALEIALENARNQEGPDSEAFQYFNGELDNSRQKIEELNAAAINALGSGPITVFKGFGTVLRGVSTAALSAAKSLGQLAANGIQKASGAFGALIKKMFSANSLLGRIRGGVKGLGFSTDSLGGIFKKMLRYGFGIRSLYALVNKLRKVMIDGFQNMAKAMPGSEIARNVNTVQSSFSRLKASVAAAAAPLFNALAPALNSIINIAIKAANAVGMLMAALTGKKFVAATSGASNAANNIGSAANNANNAAQKLKRTLMGFDEINKLNDDDDSGSSGGSGGGSGGDGGVFGSYEDMPISQNIKDFVDMLKEAWKDADFTEIGRMVGEKLNEALESIPWDKIKETARKIAKSLATFLNGFIETVDWELVGKTFAEGVNTVIEFGYTFVTTFNWKKFGEAIGRAINGFIDNVDWNKAGKMFSEGIKGMLDAAITAVETVDWSKFGEKVGIFLTSIDWSGILSKVGELICDAIIAALDFAEGFSKSVIDGLKNANWAKVKEDAKNLFDKALEINTKITDIKISLVKFGWDTISKFVGDTVSVSVSLAKKAWSSIGEFVGNAVNVTVSLTKKAGQTLETLIGTAVTATVDFVKKKGQSLANLIGTTLNATVSFAKKHGQSLSDLIGTATSATVSFAKKRGQSLEGLIGTAMSATVSFQKKTKQTLGTLIGTTHTVTIAMKKKAGQTLKKLIGSAITVTVNLKKSASNSWSKIAGKKAEGGVYQNGHWTPIHHYASGGSPDGGQMFIAREAGPELVGTLGRHTAVMNNNQIVSSVAAGVYRAVLAAMSANEGNGITEVHVHLEGDAKKMFKVVQTEADNYLNSTGLSPFPI